MTNGIYVCLPSLALSLQLWPFVLSVTYTYAPCYFDCTTLLVTHEHPPFLLVVYLRSIDLPHNHKSTCSASRLYFPASTSPSSSWPLSHHPHRRVPTHVAPLITREMQPSTRAFRPLPPVLDPTGSSAAQIRPSLGPSHWISAPSPRQRCV